MKSIALSTFTLIIAAVALAAAALAFATRASAESYTHTYIRIIENGKVYVHESTSEDGATVVSWSNGEEVSPQMVETLEEIIERLRQRLSFWY